MKKGRLCITTASLLATMASKKKLRLSNRQPVAASTERTRSSASIQNQRAELQLLLATKAGQEQSMNAPSSSAKKPHLASTAGQGYFIFTAEGERRTGRREDIFVYAQFSTRTHTTYNIVRWFSYLGLSTILLSIALTPKTR
jgi:hypothetical protein